MTTGDALATLPTSSSDCIIFLMRACSAALPLPLLDAISAAVLLRSLVALAVHGAYGY